MSLSPRVGVLAALALALGSSWAGPVSAAPATQGDPVLDQLVGGAYPARSGALHSSTTGSVGDPANPQANRPAQPMAEDVLWSESFDGSADATGFTHRAPSGWSIASSGFTTGEARWAGWAFSTIRDWTWAVGTDRRHWFTGAHNTFAVVESEHQRLAERDRMTIGLSTPTVRVAGEQRLALRFDSHYAQGASPQRAAVYVSFDGRPRQQLLAMTSDRLSAHEDLAVDVPRGARTARFTFAYEQGRNDRWWAIDNVKLVRPLGEVRGKPLATFDVMSDIHVQGGADADPTRRQRYAQAIGLFARQPDKAGALALVGDVTELGTAADYAAAKDMLARTPHASGKLLLGAGNHEYLGKEQFAQMQRRFLDLAGRRVPWGEVTVNGIPALMISTEYYSDVDRHGVEPYVTLGRQQLAWLEQRLAHHARTGTPVLLMNHHPLPQSVSFTHSAWYGNDFADLSALNAVMARYGNIVYLSGHTHAWLGLNDWWGTYRVNGSGNPAGFPAVNTGSLLNAGLPDGDHDESRMPGDHATALRVKVYGDRVRVEAWDVLAGTMTKSQDFPVTREFARHH